MMKCLAFPPFNVRQQQIPQKIQPKSKSAVILLYSTLVIGYWIFNTPVELRLTYQSTPGR
jgi:hypothetical protein